ncbi:MAG: ATP-dependent 6-phosphofructokinase [Janthinobacterium lividum]
MTKRIGILTSGGDCAGLNAVLRAVTLRAIQSYGWEVYGIRQGTEGLLKNPVDYQKLDLKTFEGPIQRSGGTMLGSTTKGNPLAYVMDDKTVKDRSQEFIDGCRSLGLEAIIGIGGDGSLRILRDVMAKANMPFIGIPKTIDNDLDVTESSIGFTTAVEIATEALDRLQPTAASHDRVMILEVMGRDAGHIALSAGIAGGADIILIPEISYKLDHIVQKIENILKTDRKFALLVVAEAVKTEDNTPLEIQYANGQARYGGIGHYLSAQISSRTKAETRFTVLGHVQRGAPPIASDRILASSFGVCAVDLIAQNKYDRMVAWQNRRVIDVPILDAIKVNRVVDPHENLVHTARGLNICLGDEP